MCVVVHAHTCWLIAVMQVCLELIVALSFPNKIKNPTALLRETPTPEYRVIPPFFWSGHPTLFHFCASTSDSLKVFHNTIPPNISSAVPGGVRVRVLGTCLCRCERCRFQTLQIAFEHRTTEQVSKQWPSWIVLRPHIGRIFKATRGRSSCWFYAPYTSRQPARLLGSLQLEKRPCLTNWSHRRMLERKPESWPWRRCLDPASSATWSSSSGKTGLAEFMKFR